MHPDVQKTENYYRSIEAAHLCGCLYCKSYCRQVKSAYPAAAAYLASLGVDIEKPFETSPLEPDENGILEYCACQYIVFGSCPDSYQHQIGDVTFRRAASHPGTGISAEHFVLEFSPIRLKFSIFQ